MRIIRDLQELAASPLGKTVVTLGNFDGVHLGHREIFRLVVRRARELGAVSTVVTFAPHPLKVLAPRKAPRLINTGAEKERLLEASCIDALVWLPFDRRMSELSAEEFVRRILVESLGVRHLIIGYDYAFGKGRQGNGAFLQRMGERFGYTVEILEPIALGGQVYSSSRIRQLILEGDVAGVVALLGRHFTLEGTVVHGAKRGKGLGFPTANLDTDKELLPRPGVYAVKVRYLDQVLDGVVNIGCNPTFCVEGLSVEVHLFDFSAELYGQTLRLYFMERLRDEMVFASPQELVKAIRLDVEKARGLLVGRKIVEFREYLDCGAAVGDGAKGENS